MSVVSPQSQPESGPSSATLQPQNRVPLSSSDDTSGKLFDSFPDADIILRSNDSHEFFLPKLYIVHSSPVLAKSVRSSSVSSDDTTTAQASRAESSFPTVQISYNRVILSNLLTFIFPVPAILPSTVEQIMELLSAAQKYEMGAVLTRIWDRLARQDPPFVRPENAFHIYSLAQQYGLRDEARQAARISLSISMTFDDLDDQLEIMPGAFLYELWKYHQRVRGNLLLDLLAFRMTGVRDALKDQQCVKLSSLGIPSWLDEYIDSIAKTPASFNLTKFHLSLTQHTAPTTPGSGGCLPCASMSGETIHTFWAALTAVVNNSLGIAESDLLLLASEARSRSRVTSTVEPLPPSPPQNLNLRDADVILQSSDRANFRVHKAVLAASSPFFSDMFSLAQPSDDEIIDGFPVVCLSENAEVLYCLVTMLYPIPSLIPNSYDKVLDLLAAAQKYDMAAVQSSIRAEVNGKARLTLSGNGTFHAYAIACSKRLSPEIESAARLTLDSPMTFESIGDEVGLFDGWALRDLARFRKRCRDSVVLCLETFLDLDDGPSDVWVGCPQTQEPISFLRRGIPVLAGWLHDFISQNIRELRKSFTRPLLERSNFRKQYLIALRTHIGATNCLFCARQHVMEGESFLEELQNKVAQARDMVRFDAEH